MISPKDFVTYLESKNFHFYTGVPCSYFKSVIEFIKDWNRSSYYIAPNEGSALALASGASLSGNPAVVMIQNSGLGNLINPLTSLSMIYELPVLIFVTGRAYGISDEPQHEIMGRTMGKLLDAIGILHWDLPTEGNAFQGILDTGIQEAKKRNVPVVFFVAKGTFGPYASCESQPKSEYSMKRIDAIKEIAQSLCERDLVFSTTGKISRELFSVYDRKNNFYMQGSMGHIGSLALGAALSHPDRSVIVLDGDGAFLMHLGAVSTIGHYQPEHFYHLVLDNEAYETTGNQDTTSSTVDFEMIAKACGYRMTRKVAEVSELRNTLRDFFTQKGPALLHIKVNRIETKDIPRITTRYSAPQISRSFHESVRPTHSAQVGGTLDE